MIVVKHSVFAVAFWSVLFSLVVFAGLMYASS